MSDTPYGDVHSVNFFTPPDRPVEGGTVFEIPPNKENIRKWVDALRSGEFKQTTGRLRNDAGEYCCLGVACEVAIKDGIDLVPFDDGYLRPELLGYTGGTMPVAVREWLGLSGDPIIGTGEFGLPLSAISTNDSHGWSFDQIADAIEREYLA